MADDKITLGIISHQRIAKSMAGPGIRCWEFARALAGDAHVILFSPEEPDLEPQGFELATYSDKSLVGQLTRCDAILCQGFILTNFPQLKSLGKYLLVDLYVPLTLEALAQYEHSSLQEQNALQVHILSAIFDQLAAGHFFFCASERQRDFWLGLLSAAGRLDAVSFNADRSLHKLIDVVPFGLPEEPPLPTGKALKGIHPGIGENDRVLLWGGGIYNWLDPFTPIRAAALLAEKRYDVKLFFMGTRHPDSNVPRMKIYDEAVELSRELGALDSSVFFNDKWVAYEERVNFLLEADLGVNANIDHIETRFSFRTRILDCIWSSLPVVSTRGDSLSSLVVHRGLGLVTESGDHYAYADAIEKLLSDDGLRNRCRSNLKGAAREFRWSETTKPLKRFINGIDTNDRAAPDIGRLIFRMAGDTETGNAGRPPENIFRWAAGKIKSRVL